MISIIGLGNCGCNIAQKFSVYPQYKTYYINNNQYYGHKNQLWPEYRSPEEYEEKCPDMSSFFEDIDEEVLFIVGGSAYISTASLKLLSCIRDKKISILYIKPDVEFLSETKKLVENCTFHILQEYARSGVFERIFLFENSSLEKMISNLTIANFYDKINDHIVPIIHMINVFDKTEPVMTSFSAIAPTSRICTIGTVDFSSGEEKMFFPLDTVREKRYYCGVNEEALENDSSVLGEIKKHLRLMPEDVRTSFSIYPTSYKDNFTYVVYYTSEIQTKNHARVE
tara:strand:- start:620 stop:1468 length:849 start_codon:yes stop_codon:yes gene_type:complete